MRAVELQFGSTCANPTRLNRYPSTVRMVMAEQRSKQEHCRTIECGTACGAVLLNANWIITSAACCHTALGCQGTQIFQVIIPNLAQALLPEKSGFSDNPGKHPETSVILEQLVFKLGHIMIKDVPKITATIVQMRPHVVNIKYLIETNSV